jgi:Zn-dependent M28 family amino/carboxypeptidase
VIKMVALFVAGLLALLIAALAAAYWYSLSLPGEPYTGPTPPVTAVESDLGQRLRRHVEAIASEPHNVAHYAALERSAAYIESELKALGYQPQSQVYDIGGKPVRNISIELSPPGATAATPSLVIGAHYDSADDAPGANDNGSGSAAVLELARGLKNVPLTDKRLRLVLFVNEEPPYDRTRDMGSYRFAKALHDKGEKLVGMISLETIGSFSDKPGSQRYPFPFSHVFSDVGNFIAFVALPGGRAFLHEVVGAFREHTQFPTIGGTAPDNIPGIGWSDHWAFWTLGYPAIMVTDTAPFRYRDYHKPTDTPDKLDYDKLARITLGMEQAVRDILR